MQVFQSLFVVECVALGLSIREGGESKLQLQQLAYVVFPSCTYDTLVYLVRGHTKTVPVNAGDHIANELGLEV